MLTYLRNIRKSLIDSRSVRKYVLYAFGEIFLVMIGILLALQVNRWNENRKDRAFEILSLVQIKGDLLTDIASLNRQDSFHKNNGIKNIKAIELFNNATSIEILEK